MLIDPFIDKAKKDLNLLLISPKMKKEIFNKLQKKIKKKSKSQKIKNYVMSLKKSKPKNNRKTKIRKRIMISKLKKYSNRNDVKSINKNTPIKQVSDIYYKYFIKKNLIVIAINHLQ